MGAPGEGGISRRSLLQAGAVAGQAGFQPASPAEAATETLRPRKISDNLFVLEDTCNVYVVRDGRNALLIDFGSGAILKHLGDLGISRVDWILHTHHHRDQAQGDDLAAAERIPVAVPAHERRLFESVEEFWANRRVYHLYDVRNDFFSLTQNVPVAASLHDYELFRWRGREFLIQPTPGHTPGSITIIGEVDGRRIAFSGDLMHSPGKVQTLYDLQYYYAEHEGVDLTVYSLRELMRLKPALLCPSHGSEVFDPLPGMQELAGRLTAWWRFWRASPLTSDAEPAELTPHVIAHTFPTSSFYAVLSRSGKALFIDYGSASWDFFRAFLNATSVGGRIRFVEHSIERLRARHGLKSIEVAVPTHMHDDHLNGFPHLARRYGTKIWCFENMAGILANPGSRNLGCVFGEPLRAERLLRDKETFRWEEFEFTARYSPGHTKYQMALFAAIDGKRIAFTGDAFFSEAGRPNELRHNLIYRNAVHSGDHLLSIRNVMDFEPQIIAPGHGAPFAIDRGMAEAFAERALRQDAHFRDLIADPDVNIGLDPSWVRIEPYLASVVAGATHPFEICVYNPRQRPMKIAARLALPKGWTSDPSSVTLEIPPGAERRSPVAIRIPASWRGSHSRVAVAADVTADGKRLGQIAEAVIEIRSQTPAVSG